MEYYPEGARKKIQLYTMSFLLRAIETKIFLESRALSFGADRKLHFMLGEFAAEMPFEECANGVREGKVRDIAVLTRVGRPVCFLVTGVRYEGATPTFILSRAEAQQSCKAEYVDKLNRGDILACRVTHLENFGAFCDIGCGISALLPIDCMSVSRIATSADRLSSGEDIFCAVKSRDEQGRLVLTLKELLGSWSENAARFAAGETVIGIVRSVENYGAFIELAPNLAGLAEATPELHRGQIVSVFIKSILPDKMKIKLVVLSPMEDGDFKFPLHMQPQSGHIDRWKYSPDETEKCIETIF